MLKLLFFSALGALAAPKTDSVPFSSGQVVALASSVQNNQSVSYRILVVRASVDSERNLKVVVQKVLEEVDGTTAFHSLVEQIVVPTESLPQKNDAEFISIDARDDPDKLHVRFTTGMCEYIYKDAKRPNKTLSIKDWSCVEPP